MKTLRWMLLASLLSSCTLFAPVKVVVTLPEMPTLAVCPEKPKITGDLVNGKVVLSLEDAKALRIWMLDYAECAESNQAKLLGHIEKLENRIKAVAEVK